MQSKTLRWCFALPTWLAVPTVAAQTAPDFSAGGAGNNDLFSGLIDLMQSWGDFMAGPLAMLFVLVGFFIFGVLWIFAPRAGDLIGFFIRIIVVGFGLFNVGALITTLMN